ncbi:alpha/beta hydrolase [Sinorhizobium meliloti]|uniref:alpha/beta hydrolase n=1 Tax=Rhizobium meliloti TaxID=382 RepID=UPI00191FA795|nr:alpha/beta hydrolase [Sinorhizobium meliloti]
MIDKQGLSRRRLLLSTSIVSVGLMVAGAASATTLPLQSTAATNATASAQIADVNVRAVEFMNNDIKMSGNVYYPKDFTEGRKYPALVVVHPGGGVKEQTAGLYAQKLATEGFITLAFDASHQGASGGMPRFIDDPMKRVVDFYSAVDYLTSLAYVDADNIGALGVCAGSGITVKASMTDRRIKAIATVSAVDVGAATRKGWDGKGDESATIATLEAVAKQRSAEATGAEPVYVNYVPKLGDTTAPRDLQEAAEYYLTPRGQYPTSTNQMLMTSVSTLASFTGFEGAETFITQPLLMIAGSEAGSLWHSEELNARAASAEKELFVVDGATHMDLYDGAGATLAAKKLAPFFQRNLVRN